MNFFTFLTKYHTRIVVMIILTIAVSFSVIAYSNKYDNTKKLIKHISSIEETLVKIKSYPSVSGNTVTFMAEIIDAPEAKLNGLKMNVNLKRYTKGVLYPGDVLILDGLIFHGEEKRNTGGFDNIEYNKSLNTYGTIFCDENADVSLYYETKNQFMKKMSTFRTKFMNKADEMLLPRFSGIAKALVTGDRTSIYPIDKTSFQHSGVYHIVAISGLHLNIFIMVFAYFISSLKIKRSKKAIMSAIICTLVGSFVLIFTGFGTSVIRAFVMLIISLGCAIFCRKYSPKNSLFMTTVIIIALMPWAFYSVGFKLSVLSTLGVLISADLIKYLHTTDRLSRLASYSIVGTAITSFVCAAVTLPVTADAFGYLAVYSFLSNILILPLMAPALCGCVLFGIAALAELNTVARLIAYPLSFILRLILFFADFVASLPMSTINLYPKYTLFTVIFICFIALGIYFLKKRRIIAAFTTLFIFMVAVGFNFVYNKDNSNAKVIFPYTGQGDAAIVTFPGDKAFMIDFGSNSYTEYLLDEVRLSLVKYNIKKLDAVFVSHFHTDHISGIIWLTENGYINNILVPKDFDKKDTESMENFNKLLAASLKSHTPISYLDSKSSLKYGDDICFDVILPTEGMDLDANDMSLVLKFTYGDTSFLFTGDISNKTTKYLYQKDIDCNVIKIPHHGSKSSDDSIFIKAVSPEYALISCGENNVYKHPDDEVIETLDNLDVKTYRTDRDGTVTFYLDKNSIKSIKTMR